jgi:glycerophosphoryl diester phosphodiesterase
MRLVPLVAVVLAISTSASATAADQIEIHAHRGGTVSDGRPAFAEESLAAYRHAAQYGFVFEVDAKLTRDRVPVAIHDATLDRTTACTGAVAALRLGAVRACRPDVLGSPGGGLRTRVVRPSGRIATIAQVLELARLTGSTVNLEIKNLPTDPDWDPTPAYANRIMDVVLASGLPRRQLLIQSFLPANLDVARQRMPRVPTSLLTIGPSNDVPDVPYDWISPQWPQTNTFVTSAHQDGYEVAPYTLNDSAAVRAAGRAGVDAVITDDPLMAARALGRRPAEALRVRLRRRASQVEATGRLRVGRRAARGAPRRACSGRVTLRVLGGKRTLQAANGRLRRDCTFDLSVLIPRGAPARLLATVGFGGNAGLLPKLVGPRAVPREVPLAVPHAGQQAG